MDIEELSKSLIEDSYDKIEWGYENLTYRKFKDHIEITDINESAEEIEIPAEIDGLPVTDIGRNNGIFFQKMSSKNLKSIIIPESVERILSLAFENCENLESVTILNSTINIGYAAFQNCKKLKSITIPENDKICIEKNAFTGTLWLENKRKENPFVVLNGTLIDAHECTDNPVIPENVRIIGEDAFNGCEQLKSVIIPESVTSIKESSFSCCENLESLKILNPECNIESCIFGFNFLNPFTHVVIENFLGKFKGTIYGYDGSTAQKYAENYNLKFVSLGKPADM